MEKRILIVSSIFIILIVTCICYKIFENDVSIPVSEDIIKNPDRLVFKIENSYYEITKDDEKYEELVQLCRENFNESNEKNITEKEIDSLKNDCDFIEFDYDTISKNNIFFLSGDIGVVKMKDTDGIIISKKLVNSKKLINEFKKIVKNKESYQFENMQISAKNDYEYYPSTMDFEEIKYSKVFKKEFDSYEQFEKIVELYKLDFGDFDIKDKFDTNKIILILSQYNILDYKVNIGNIKINFEGNDYVIPKYVPYKPVIIMVSKIVNTNCIYYNYDKVTEVDNLTGTSEEIYGVIKSKNSDGSFNLGYNSDNDNMITGIINSSTDISFENLEVGDFIKSTGIITSFDKSTHIKTYELKELSVNKKEEYEKQISNYLMGKIKLDTDIIDYYESESQYDGFVICTIDLDQEDFSIDGYVKIYYDFYEGNTESFLGMGTHIEDNYGIVKNEIVTITFKDKITDINKIEARMFEYIAD